MILYKENIFNYPTIDYIYTKYLTTHDMKLLQGSPNL